MGDEFFDWAPRWAREALKGNPACTMSDICRLEWIKQSLLQYKKAIWADIDLLIVDPRHVRLDLNRSYGFSYELYFDDDNTAHHGINNAFMFFQRGSSMLSVYLERCYEVLRQRGDGAAVARTAIGPDLVRSLNVPESHVIHGLNILNFPALYLIHKDPRKRIPDYIRARMGRPLGGANLCLNERPLPPDNDRFFFDEVADDVVRHLLRPPPG
jgi:hypothetical protein